MAFISAFDELEHTTVLIESSPSLEKFVASDGVQKWKFDVGHHKKIYPFMDTRSLEDYKDFKLSAGKLHEEKQLHAHRHLLEGACELAACFCSRDDAVALAGSGFWLSPPVTATADLCRKLQLADTWEGKQVVLFSSAWHVFAEVSNVVYLSSPVCVSSFMRKKMLSAQFKILATPSAPSYDGVPASMRSPLVNGHDSESRSVSQATPSAYDQPADFMIGIMLCEPELETNTLTPNTFFCACEPFWRTPASAFADADDPTPAERSKVVAICGYPGGVTDVYLRATYDVPWQLAAEVQQKVSETLLVADRLSVAAGDMVAASRDIIKHTCSSVPGMSGAALFPVDQPRTAYATHIRRALGGRDSVAEVKEHNFNYAFSLDADVFVLNYAKFVLPALMLVTSWPAAYMIDSLVQYLYRHKQTLLNQQLWQVVEGFVKAQPAAAAAAAAVEAAMQQQQQNGDAA